MLDSLVNDPQARRKLMKFIILGLILLLMWWVIAWLYGHSIISVKVNNPNNQKLTYKVVNQSTKRVETVETTSPNLNRRVSKGDYEVLVSYPEHSYFTVIKTKSFLAKTKLAAQLLPERSRTFVGNEPQPCSYYNQVLLISSPCSGTYDKVFAHSPATDETPTITVNEAPELANFSFGGIIQLQNKRYAYVQGNRNPESSVINHQLVEVDDSLHPLATISLQGLEGTKERRIERYRSGFVVYTQDFSEIKYYSGSTARPEAIHIDSPAEKGLKPISLSVYGERIAILYSKGLPPEEEPERDSSGKETLPASKKVAQVFERGKTKSIDLGDGVDGISSVIVCGSEYLCYKSSSDVSVININNEKARVAFKINDVKSVQSDGKSIFVERDNEVLGIDLALQTGFIQYSYGAYKSCGTQPAEPLGYVLCVVNPKQDLVALYINPQETNKDSIDKKILPMFGQWFIDSVSVYKSYVYIVLDFGDRVSYNPDIRGYDFDAALKAQALRDLNELLSKTNIDRSVYKIINTLE